MPAKDPGHIFRGHVDCLRKGASRKPDHVFNPFQQLSDGSFVIQNYNQAPAEVKIALKQEGKLRDRFDGKEMTIKENRLTVTIPARSRVWIGK